MNTSTVPVVFEYLGKEFTGTLTDTSGSGSHHWQLMSNNRYFGQLLYSKHFGWQFSSNCWTDTKQIERLSAYFRDVMVAWYQ